MGPRCCVSIWQPAAGRIVSFIRVVEIVAPTNWGSSDAFSAPAVVIRSSLTAGTILAPSLSWQQRNVNQIAKGKRNLRSGMALKEKLKVSRLNCARCSQTC
jgi:hypothetical protein